MKTVVCTTIGPLSFLEEYYQNLKDFDHLHDTRFIVIGDGKSPASCPEEASKFSDRGMNVAYFSLEQQIEWMAQFPELDACIPKNNESRRSIGFLMALSEGAELLISIDDDNFPLKGNDFIAGHSLVGTTEKLCEISSSTGLFNLCSRLSCEPDRPIYPRGYPYGKRMLNTNISKDDKALKVGINAGLWINSPDIDATTWLNGAVYATKSEETPLALCPNTWTPINTQNTAIMRELIPAYLCVPMGVKIGDLRLERYGDIWSGYFCQAIAKKYDWAITCGNPICDHRRNPHDYIMDLYYEFWGIQLVDVLYEHVRNVELSGNAVSDDYRILANEIAKGEFLPNAFRSIHDLRDYLENLGTAMCTWADACDRVMN